VPRYFFHLYDDVFVPDSDGHELPDLEAAREFAIANIRAMLTEDVLKGRLPLDHQIDIADSSDTIVCSVSFRDAVRVEGSNMPRGVTHLNESEEQRRERVERIQAQLEAFLAERRIRQPRADGRTSLKPNPPPPRRSR
jgi:hypothetical protein